MHRCSRASSDRGGEGPCLFSLPQLRLRALPGSRARGSSLQRGCCRRWRPGTGGGDAAVDLPAGPVPGLEGAPHLGIVGRKGVERCEGGSQAQGGSALACLSAALHPGTLHAALEKVHEMVSSCSHPGSTHLACLGYGADAGSAVHDLQQGAGCGEGIRQKYSLSLFAHDESKHARSAHTGRSQTSYATRSSQALLSLPHELRPPFQSR